MLGEARLHWVTGSAVGRWVLSPLWLGATLESPGSSLPSSQAWRPSGHAGLEHCAPPGGLVSFTSAARWAAACAAPAALQPSPALKTCPCAADAAHAALPCCARCAVLCRNASQGPASAGLGGHQIATGCHPMEPLEAHAAGRPPTVQVWNHGYWRGVPHPQPPAL